MENAKLQKEIEAETNRRKAYAREKYNKFDHYNYLINNYFIDRRHFDNEISRIFQIDRIIKWIKPIGYARKSIGDMYYLLRNIQDTDFLLKEDILDGKNYLD